MATFVQPLALDSFSSFGDLLKYLRRRERLTQLELSIKVGYSEAQISRLEKNQRRPDLTALQALFLPALDIESQPALAARLLELAQSTREEVAPAPGVAPYKGLLFFDEPDAEWFFGREALTARLCVRVNSLVGAPPRLLAVVGASGSGKSSLVRAGLAVALKRAGWDTRVLTPTAEPLKMLGGLAAGAEGNTKTTRFAWVVDQFEEVFTLCREEAARAAFVEQLLTAANEPNGLTTVVIALRADFYSHCAQFPRFREAIAGQQEFIGQMSAEELRQAIEGPAQHGGWDLEPGLVDILLRDIGAGGVEDQEPGALPLLSHALLATWERRRGRTLTLDGYRACGGVRGAIAETAESVFADRLDRRQRQYARNIFLRLTELGEGTEDTRRRAALTELVPDERSAADLRAVLNTLADARLVILGEDSAEVAHEALIREWQRLREWLNQDRDGLRLHRQLTQAAREWEALQRDPGALYRGARLAQALEWAAANPDALNAQERAFLDASKEFAEREAAEREVQRRRELEAAQRLVKEQRRRAEEQLIAAKRLRQRGYFLASAFVLAIVLAAVTLFFGEQASQNALAAQTNERTAEQENTAAEQERANAEQERRTASARELAASALTNLDSDPDLSLLLALQAVSSTYTIDKTVTAEAENALHQAVLAARAPLTLRGHTDWVERAAFSPDGTRIGTVSDDGSYRVWDTSTGSELLNVSSDPHWDLKGEACGCHPRGSKVLFSRDGARMITLHVSLPNNPLAENTVALKTWDISSGKQLQAVSLDVFPGLTTSDALSPDATRMAFSGEDNIATVWDLTAGRLLATLQGHAGAVLDVEFSPDGTRIATASADGTAKIWDARTGNLILTLSGHTQPVVGVAFSPDGTRLATASDDSTAKIWDAQTGRELLTLSGHTNSLTSIAFSPDGRRVATASIDRKAIVWDAEKGTILFNFLGHGAAVDSVAFSPDGNRLVTASRDNTAKVWDLSPTREWLTLSGPSIRGFGASADGKRVAAAYPDGTVQVWDTLSGAPLITLPGKGLQEGKPEGSGDVSLFQGILGSPFRDLQQGEREGTGIVAFSPDGSRLVRSNDDKTVRVWDVAAGKVLFELMGDWSTPIGVAYSPDGSQIATTRSSDYTAEVWDAASSRRVFTLSATDGNSIAFSPDGNLIATGYLSDVMLSDAHTGKFKDILTGQTVPVFGLAFSPDGKRLVTGSRDGTAIVWDLATGKQLFTLSGHTSSVFAVAFSHDGTRIATGSYDGTTKIWDAATGKELLTLYGHTGKVNGVAFTPDDTRLITSSEDGTIRFYLLRIEDLIALARTRLTRSWTTEECQKYLHVDQCPPAP